MPKVIVSDGPLKIVSAGNGKFLKFHVLIAAINHFFDDGKPESYIARGVPVGREIKKWDPSIPGFISLYTTKDEKKFWVCLQSSRLYHAQRNPRSDGNFAALFPCLPLARKTESAQKIDAMFEERINQVLTQAASPA